MELNIPSYVTVVDEGTFDRPDKVLLNAPLAPPIFFFIFSINSFLEISNSLILIVALLILTFISSICLHIIV